MSLKGVNRS